MWQLWCLLLCFLVDVHGNTDPLDVEALNVLYSSLQSPNVLTNWVSGGGDPCGSRTWKGVTCSGSAVKEIHLSGLGLNGGLGYNLDKMKSLTVLELSNNNIGSGLPYQLPPNLQRLDLSGNAFKGELPYSISNMKSLKYLSLSRNQLTILNDIFWNLKSLTTIDLSQNAFTGNLPKSFTGLSSLDTLYLQNNQFTGTIDVLADLPLSTLNVANNRFNGWIPDRLKNIENIETGGNSWNSGSAPSTPSARGSQSESDSGGKKSGIGGGGIAGIVISILVVCSVVAFFLIRKKSRSDSPGTKPSQSRGLPSVMRTDSTDMKPIPIGPILPNNDSKIPVQVQNPPPVHLNVLKPPPSERHTSSVDLDSVHQYTAKKTDRDPISVDVYSIADLQMATGSFNVDNLLGEGSIGRVYRANFDDGKTMAVKKIKSVDFTSHATEEFLDVVSDISRIHHPYVAELVAYCSEHGQHLLVYDFYRNGSLYDFLHLSDEYSKPLTWNTRVKIALGTARALEYLHEACSPSVVHNNIKSVNILLDADLSPHLSDCGLSKLSSNVDYQAMGEHQNSGYSAPEVMMSAQYSFKSDVFSFGVIMLELLTGRKPFDSSRSRLEQSLVRWATPQLYDIDALDRMVDPALKGLYPAKSLSRFADVIALCVQSEPEFRPPISEVVQALVRLIQRANLSKRVGSLDDQEASQHSDVDIHDMF